ERKSMKLVTTLVVLSFAFAGSARAFRITELNGRHVQLYPTRHAAPSGAAKASNVTYHNGAVIHQAKVVSIFWGPAAVWGSNGSPTALAKPIIAFFGQFGTTPQYNVITQYYDFSGSVQPTNLSTWYWIDNSTPPTSVTDATVQNEVLKVALFGLDPNTVYA